ncbi:hypothetical protein JCM1840_001116 [Sporobolomyces johnsonii]
MSPVTAPPSPAATAPGPPAIAAAQQQQAAFRPLNVRDALQYLDRVKQQFASEYEVYDQFLTIMKDFKTQNIDTPGVIDRVSTLFRGHPSLIQGFNTFLPPGYRIECHVSPNADGSMGGVGSSNTITVTTPMGITTRTQNVGGPAVPPAPAAAQQPPAVQPTQPAATPAPPAPAPAARPPPSLPSTSRLPPLPHLPTAPPRPISPPAPIPPFGGGSAGRERAGGMSWQQGAAYGAGAGRGRTSTPGGVAAAMATQAQRTAAGASQAQVQAQPTGAAKPAAPSHAQSSLAHAPIAQAPAVGRQEVPAPGAAVDHPAPPVAQAPPQPQQPQPPQPPQQPLQGPQPQPQIMEFNHAITYVNKIKTRFAREPETYKTFLEILQTYQKDGRPIQEVYTQVTALFRDAPDLLDEFKAFLPDTTGETGPPQPAPPAVPSPALKKKDSGTAKAVSGAGMGTGRGKQPEQQVGEKKKRAAPGMGEKSKAKRAKMAHAAGGVESPPIMSAQPSAGTSAQAAKQALAEVPMPPSPYAPPHPHAAHPAHPHPYGAPPPGFPGAPRMQSAYDAYLSAHRTPPLVQPDEFGFFDRVKKYIDDRQAYTEFLKLLNLFTQEIIDLPTLLSKSLLFIGGSDELVAQFKALVGWDPVKDGRVDGEDWIIDNEPVLDRQPVLLHLMKSFGPSYRKLPDSEIDLACSGRSALEWSVLNDEWVAYATWASEGSGAHRKNPYEEALYNSEQERHWYSFHLASIARTIAHFEPLAARIALMSSEERASLRIVAEDGTLGGSAPSVYERIIRKIYGKDHGWEILQALEDNPAVAVPIVLARLKQKDEEWKRAEKEWNKVWREVDAKNFYRALDHQGIPFKAVDKKTTTTSKALTNEIETLRRDKQQKRFDVPSPSASTSSRLPPASTITTAPPVDPFADSTVPPSLRPLHQFELYMTDRAVLFDVLKLTFSYLDRDQSGFSVPERARVEAFLRLFVPLLWGVEKDELEANLGHSAHDDAADADEDDGETEADGAASDADSAAGEGESSTASSAGGGGKRAVNGSHKRGGAADLRKRLLLHAAATAGRTLAASAAATAAATAGGKSASRAASPTGVADDVQVGALGEAVWIQLSETKEGGGPAPSSADEVLEPRRFNFFANSTFYCLVRVIHTMYHRLLTFKELAATLAASGKHRRLSPLGVDLGLSNPSPLVDLGDNPAEHYYEHALELAEKLFDGDVDHQTYEEQLRYMAGVRAYPLFTLDKLISTAIKHIHTINSDAKCQDIVALLEKDRAQPVTTPRQQIAYRMEAEAILGLEENLYRIEWIPDAQALTIQLLGKEDLTLDDAYGSDAKMHQSWIASYALTSPSEGIGAQVKAPLLKRNRALAAAAEDPEQQLDLSPGLEVKVPSGGYQLFFVARTEDFLHRPRPAEEPAEEGEEVESQEGVQRRRKERFERWLREKAHVEEQRGAVLLPPQRPEQSGDVAMDMGSA